ncbi:MAG TPA: twin-arginine translocase subunit TatC [Chitinophagaceae bacterium]|nr:twin-arginine translocase subunit TatC [Chitinophagaceae bacterium]
MGFFSKISSSELKAEMSFIDHIDELRKHLFRSVIAIGIGAIVVGIYNKFIIRNILMGPTHPDFPTYTYLCKLGKALNMANDLCLMNIHVKMQSNAVAGQFNVFINVIFIGGLILAFPYVFWQFWKFVKPALKENELKGTRGVIFWVSLLFFIGVLFGYFVVAPYTIYFFASFTLDSNIENFWTIASYFNTMMPLVLGSGLAFQLPLVLYFLAKIGVVNSKFLKKYRKHAILIITIVTSIITPPDILSTVICSIPLIILYEISILLCLRVEKKQAKEEATEWS